MPNGKLGDHPYTDIVVHGRDTYSPAVSTLVREIARLADDKTLRELTDMLIRDFNEYSSPDVPKLERLLTAMRDHLRQGARERGFEM